MKAIYLSKTLWANVIAAAVAILGIEELKTLLGPNALQYFALAQTVLNIVLRFVTTQPVSLTGDGGK
jgi:hypothetical protein